jgi:hypothetical protein
MKITWIKPHLLSRRSRYSSPARQRYTENWARTFKIQTLQNTQFIDRNDLRAPVQERNEYEYEMRCYLEIGRQ